MANMNIIFMQWFVAQCFYNYISIHKYITLLKNTVVIPWYIDGIYFMYMSWKLYSYTIMHTCYSRYLKKYCCDPMVENVQKAWYYHDEQTW